MNLPALTRGVLRRYNKDIMPSTKSLKQRIRSVKNTSQITKAMEVVSATKMRRSQEFARAARPFALAGLQMLQNLLIRTTTPPPLLLTRPVIRTALLVVTSDKGLAGAFNANILKKADDWIREQNLKEISFVIITVGKKARDYFEPRGNKSYQSFWGFGDYSRLEQTLPVAQLILEGFLTHTWDRVDVVYTNFRTTLRQETVIKKILPAEEKSLEDAVHAILPEYGKYADITTPISDASYTYEYLFEPSPAEILEALVPQLLRMHVHQIILESNASEHSARMVAMKNASESATELISGLSLAYNKARQSGITREIVEITAGAEAMGNM